MHIAINAHLLNTQAGYRQSGVSRYIANLLPAIGRVAKDVTRWTIFAPPGVPLPADFPKCAPITWINSALPTSAPVARIFWEQFVGPLAIAHHRPDVMLCPLNVVPILAPCPTVVVVHDLAFIRLKTHRFSRRSYLSGMTRWSIRRSSHVIAVSDFTRREVIDLLGTDSEKVTTVLNGCDSVFCPIDAIDLAVWRKKHDLPDRYLLCVGTLEPRKNLVGLIEAYAEFRKREPIPLVIVGAPGWRFAPIFQVVKSLGLEDQVRFEGFVPDADLPFYYGGATAFVYPSLYEGFGLPPLEAMAMGTPVITSDVSSMPEVVGDAALLVSPTSRADLVAAMIRVVGDEPLRGRLSAAGRERAKLFNWDDAAATVTDILRTAAGGDAVKRAGVELSAP